MFMTMKTWTYDLLGINAPTIWDHASDASILIALVILVLLTAKLVTDK